MVHSCWSRTDAATTAPTGTVRGTAASVWVCHGTLSSSVHWKSSLVCPWCHTSGKNLGQGNFGNGCETMSLRISWYSAVMCLWPSLTWDACGKKKKTFMASAASPKTDFYTFWILLAAQFNSFPRAWRLKVFEVPSSGKSRRCRSYIFYVKPRESAQRGDKVCRLIAWIWSKKFFCSRYCLL